MQDTEELLENTRKNIKVSQNNAIYHGFIENQNNRNFSLILQTLEAEYEEQKQTVEREEAEIIAFIDTVKNPLLKQVFTYRYICGNKWEAIPGMLGSKISVVGLKAAAYRYLEKINQVKTYYDISDT